jgi:hypothetical protein
MASPAAGRPQTADPAGRQDGLPTRAINRQERDCTGSAHPSVTTFKSVGRTTRQCRHSSHGPDGGGRLYSMRGTGTANEWHYQWSGPSETGRQRSNGQGWAFNCGSCFRAVGRPLKATRLQRRLLGEHFVERRLDHGSLKFLSRDVLRVALGILEPETVKQTLESATLACIIHRLSRRPYSRWHRLAPPGAGAVHYVNRRRRALVPRDECPWSS